MSKNHDLKSERLEIKEKIKKWLPSGYTTTIKQQLKGTYSAQYISRVCDPKSDDWNQSIIDQAIRLSKKEKSQAEKSIKSAKSL